MKIYSFYLNIDWKANTHHLKNDENVIFMSFNTFLKLWNKAKSDEAISQQMILFQDSNDDFIYVNGIYLVQHMIF